MNPLRRPRSTLFRALQRPSVVGALLFVATIALAADLAYEAARAEASHRQAAITALEHHASTAAWRFARDGRSWLEFGMDKAGGALEREVLLRAIPPDADVFRYALAEEFCDCMTAAFAHSFVRLPPGDHPRLEVIGEPLSERARDELTTRIRAFAKPETQLMKEAPPWIILAPGEPRLNRLTDVVLLWRVADAKRGSRGVYGMIVKRQQIARPLKGALEAAQFFPPRLISRKAADSLVHIEVAGANGVPLFEGGPNTHEFTGTDSLGTMFGDMIVTAAINPAAADKLIAGGLPRTRVPLIVMLLVLVLAMGGAAALLYRREYKLAQLREDFVSGVSHELRTPLTHIRMLSELLERDGFKSAPERARAIGVIHRESLRLTNLVDNILEFARLRRAATTREPARVALGEVVREVADALGPMLASQGSQLELAAADEIDVLADRDAINRVLRNLVENAAKYGRAPQTIRVTLSRVAESKLARLTVDDEGPGIPSEERTKIWQPYYRLDRDRNAPAGGSGLGLAVVADLVRTHGGTVAVGDAPGSGARFTVEFPAAT